VRSIKRGNKRVKCQRVLSSRVMPETVCQNLSRSENQQD